MLRRIFKHPVLLTVLAVSLFWACSQTIFTGRSQLRLLPIATINQMSFQQYDAYLQENNVINQGDRVELVNRVGRDLVAAVEVYYKSIGKESELQDFQWEFNVVNENVVNAFCMPGGKVVVYTGIMRVAGNEHGLAVVMGHEIAHALAHHGNERMSQGMLAQLGMTSLDIALQEKPAATRNLLMAAAGLGTQVGIMLPFSRAHETEADEIGLYLMTMAGYDPTEAAPFWERMAASSNGQSPPEFLSTHPSPDNRSARLRSLVPKAREYAAKYPVARSSKFRR